VKGELRVEIQDSNGNIIPGFSAKDCIPMKGNSTKFLVTWKGKKNLSKIKNKIIKVKFYLTKGDLYSFLISPWSTGESRGYTAGGGPGLSSTGSDIK
ncbi:MAG: hypothetical protein ABIN04_16100, partial [Ginsengibacter sp.]